jgi:hypothetical protein
VVAIFPGGELWKQQLMWAESGFMTERSDYVIMQWQNARRTMNSRQNRALSCCRMSGVKEEELKGTE